MAGRQIILDGHSHIYKGFDLAKFFSYSFDNLDFFSRASGLQPQDVIKVICLTESKNNNYFAALRSGEIPLADGLKIRKTKEDTSFILQKNQSDQIVFLRGQQIVSREKLEVLSIASNLNLSDGLPLDKLLEKLLSAQTITVLAWGVGKWMFKRGRLIAGVLKNVNSPYLFTGDNSGRPIFWPMPGLIRSGWKKGIRSINGSDPLPLSGEEYKSGSFGSLIEGDISLNFPAGDLTTLLAGSVPKITTFGSRDKIARFFSRQVKMYVKKYLK